MIRTTPFACRCLALGVVAVAMLMGCVQRKGGGGGGGGGGEAAVDLADAWQPSPESLRIYPSTRFIREADMPLLEARIELIDAMGDSIKASGRARFELRASGENPGVREGRLLYSWDIDITDLEDHRRYYDPITRTYLLRLQLTDAALTRRQVLLRVTFQPVTGERLSDEQPVRLAW